MYRIRLRLDSEGVLMSIHEIAVAVQDRNFVPALSDVEVGSQLFDAGYSRTRCRNERQQQGWDAAQIDARRIHRAFCLQADIEQIAR